MSHKVGANLGGVTDIEGIRMRCVCDAHTGCWHFRSARGKPMARNKRHMVWLFERGSISVPRAVWELSRRRKMPKGWRAFRTCDSYDCANPEHVKAGDAAAYGRALAARGVLHGNADNARKAGMVTAKLTSELKQWIVESSQTAKDQAHALQVSESLVHRVRGRWHARMLRVAPSVFDFGRTAEAA